MCGILGCYGGPIGGEFSARFTSALGLLKHRGPDGTQVWSGTDVLFGHTRLSIVDPSEASSQPMADGSERFRIVFNGEIYNYQEIRSELETGGASFRTCSDTEVILEAYKAWGTGCLERFNGMWAFAIFDTLHRELFLARDRFGVKPLYYADGRDCFLFGSEMKSLLALGVDSEPDWEQVCEFAREHGCDAGGETAFKNIHALAPGHYLLVSPQGRRLEKWWDILAQRVEIPKTFAERVRVFQGLFEDAVRLRLRNDVDTGISLSGGMDSSAVYGAARKLQRMDQARSATTGQPKKFRVFSISYPGRPSDEYPWVEKCLAFWNDFENASVIYPSPEMFPELMEQVVWHQETPTTTPTVFAFHILYRHIASLGTRVVMEGHGSDEMLGGYEHLVSAAIQTFASRNDFRSTWKASQCYSDTINPVLGQGSAGAANTFLKAVLLSRRSLRLPLRLARRIRSRSTPNSRQRYHGYVHPDIVNRCLPLASAGDGALSRFDQRSLDEFTRGSLPLVLRLVDRAGMAYSLESRSPFMDYRVVQYVFSLPESDKVERRNKEILRWAAKEWVPAEVIDRRNKMPLNLPEGAWFNSPVVSAYLADVLHSSDAINSSVIDGRALSRDLDGLIKTGFSRYDAIRVWMALSLYLWNKTLVDPYKRI
jgi:asparagine synthase (glutamine-hydrolysing)